MKRRMIAAAKLMIEHKFSVTECADALNVSRNTIYNYVRHPEWSTARDIAAQEIYSNIFNRALDTIIEALNDEKPDVATAKWALERLSPSLSGSKLDRQAHANKMLDFAAEAAEGEEVEDAEEDIYEGSSLEALKAARARMK